MREMCQILTVALEAGQPRRLRIFAQVLFLDLGVVSRANTVESAAPPLRVAADHRGFDNQPFPFPGRPKTAFDDW